MASSKSDLMYTEWIPAKKLLDASGYTHIEFLKTSINIFVREPLQKLKGLDVMGCRKANKGKATMYSPSDTH